MYHEPFGPEGTENEHSDFWTDIPEGSDMMPGVMPGMMPGGVPSPLADDLYPTGRHAAQKNEYGTGIDPAAPGTNAAPMPGDAPEQRPDIRAQGDGSGMADWDADGEVVGNFEPGSRQSTEKAGGLPASQDCDRASEPDSGL